MNKQTQSEFLSQPWHEYHQQIPLLLTGVSKAISPETACAEQIVFVNSPSV